MSRACSLVETVTSYRSVAKCALAMVLLALAGCTHQRPSLTVGSKNFAEGWIIGEIAAQHIEAKLKVPVKRVLNFGGTLLVDEAIRSGGIDIYPEYTGTAFTNILKHEKIGDPKSMLEQVQVEYTGRGLVWLPPLGFDNSFAMVVRGEDARARHLSSLSDAGKDSAGFVLGALYEFVSRPDGLPLLNSVYKINWSASPSAMDYGLLFRALSEKQVSMISAGMTDAQLATSDVRVLTDDKHVFPAYQASLVARADTLNNYPHLRETLTELSGRITTAVMRKMNFEVNINKRPPGDVAREFLSQSGL